MLSWVAAARNDAAKFLLAYVVLSCPLLVYSAGYGIDDLLVLTVATYPEITAQKLALDSANTDLTAARLQFLPTLSLSTQRNQVQYSGNGISSNNLPASNATITQPLFMGGKLVAGYGKAKAGYSVAEYALLETQERIAKKLIASYIDWWRAHEKVAALERSVAVHERLLKLIDRRHDSGIAAGVDRDLVLARLNESSAELESQMSLESTAITSLSELVGRQLAKKDLTGHLPMAAKIGHELAQIEELVANSPLVKRMYFEAEAADATASEIRSQAMPQVYFQAQRQVGNAYAPGWPAFNMLGVVVQYSTGAGFSPAVSASAAYTKAESLRSKIEAAKRELATQITSDINEYEASQHRRTKLLKSVSLTKGISDSYDRQYLVGRRSWLDLMNAVREEVQNKVALADAEASFLAASYRLKVTIEAAGH